MIWILFLLCYFELISYSICDTIIIHNVTVERDSNEHREICMKHYGKRDYIPVHKMMKKIPPLITSLPGSGNSWSRLLIEYATGYYTGSIYGDQSLIDIFAGEPFCGRR